MLSLTLPWPPNDPQPKLQSPLEQAGPRKEGLPRRLRLDGKRAGAQRMAAERLHLTITFVPPNRRANDLDNCLARMKSGLDGLADVLGVDDKHWTLTISKADTVGGMVRVEVRRA